MNAQILDGKALNKKIAKDLTKQFRGLTPKPKLVIIQVGNNAESNAYIGRKIKFGTKIGAEVEHKKFPEDTGQEEVLNFISTQNTNPKVHGIITQLPFPKQLNKDRIIEFINPTKDVDGLTSKNIKKLWENKQDAIIPATTKGIISLLEHYRIQITRKKVVVIGRSSLVGKPTAIAMINRDATVTVVHKSTKNFKQELEQADIIITAAGKPNLIRKFHVHPHQVVIDVGINVIEKSLESRDQSSEKPAEEPPKRKLVGDVNFAEVSQIVAAISPVPGGCGPMTVASLFQNLLQAYKNQIK